MSYKDLVVQQRKWTMDQNIVFSSEAAQTLEIINVGELGALAFFYIYRKIPFKIFAESNLQETLLEYDGTSVDGEEVFSVLVENNFDIIAQGFKQIR